MSLERFRQQMESRRPKPRNRRLYKRAMRRAERIEGKRATWDIDRNTRITPRRYRYWES